MSSRLVLPWCEYEKLLQKVRKRDNWRCRVCKSRRHLEIHHVIYRSQGGDDCDSNLLTLCVCCHDAEHDKKLVLLPIVPGALLNTNGEFVVLVGETYIKIAA